MLLQLYGLLVNVLDRHKTHVWSTYRFTDSVSVSYIVFVRFHVWLYELRGHQPHIVTQATQL